MTPRAAGGSSCLRLLRKRVSGASARCGAARCRRVWLRRPRASARHVDGSGPVGAGHGRVERHGAGVDHVFALNPTATGIVEIAVEGLCLLRGVGIACVGLARAGAVGPGDAGAHRPVRRIEDVPFRSLAEGAGHAAVGVLDPLVDRAPAANEVFRRMCHSSLLLAQPLDHQRRADTHCAGGYHQAEPASRGIERVKQGRGQDRAGCAHRVPLGDPVRLRDHRRAG